MSDCSRDKLNLLSKLADRVKMLVVLEIAETSLTLLKQEDLLAVDRARISDTLSTLSRYAQDQAERKQ